MEIFIEVQILYLRVVRIKGAIHHPYAPAF